MNPNAPCVGRLRPDPPEPVAEAAEADEKERVAMLEGLKEQIRKGVYRPDVRDLARSLASMMVRDL